jgi:hypothetical protein
MIICWQDAKFAVAWLGAEERDECGCCCGSQRSERHVRPSSHHRIIFIADEACVNSEPIKDKRHGSSAPNYWKTAAVCDDTSFMMSGARGETWQRHRRNTCVSGGGNVPFALARDASTRPHYYTGRAQKKCAPRRRERARRQQVTQMIRIIYLAAAGGVNLWSAAATRSLSIRYESRCAQSKFNAAFADRERAKLLQLC